MKQQTKERVCCTGLHERHFCRSLRTPYRLSSLIQVLVGNTESLFLLKFRSLWYVYAPYPNLQSSRHFITNHMHSKCQCYSTDKGPARVAIICNCWRHACSKTTTSTTSHIMNAALYLLLRYKCKVVSTATHMNTRMNTWTRGCIIMTIHMYACIVCSQSSHGRRPLMTTLKDMKVLPALPSPLCLSRLSRFWPKPDGAFLKPGHMFPCSLTKRKTKDI